jgi:hypothetical protein
VQKDAAAAIRCRMKREKIDSLSPGAGQFSASLIIDGFVLRRRPLCPAETISSFANSGRLSGRRPRRVAAAGLGGHRPSKIRLPHAYRSGEMESVISGGVFRSVSTGDGTPPLSLHRWRRYGGGDPPAFMRFICPDFLITDSEPIFGTRANGGPLHSISPPVPG